MLQAMRDEVPVTQDELAHILSCAECMNFFSKLVIENEPDRPAHRQTSQLVRRESDRC
jgi:hypothetical protein